MNKKLSLAVAAALAMGASAAQAGIIIPAGDWTIDIGGNVNAFYTSTKMDDAFDVAEEDRAQTIQTGLLPSAIGIGGKTRQNDLDIAFQFTFFVGSDSGTGDAAGFNPINVRQSYMTFGDKSWGTIKMGRDLGIFGSDAILSDMTLLGVGVGAGHGGSSTLGRIGSGYMYADWVGQISYASPNWNGFSFAVGMREPWSNGDGSNTAIKNDIGFEGKVAYEWAGDAAGKVWAGFITQKHDSDTAAVPFDDYRSDGWEIGGKIGFGGLSLVGYYYNGDGLSGDVAGSVLPTNITLNGFPFLASSGGESDDEGGYVQAVYTLPNVGTKIGLSWGTSKSEAENETALQDEFENESWMIGVYHPLTKSLNLVAEYIDQDVKNFGYVDGVDGEAKTIALGAIMFF